jgi:hypothetical protein
MPEKSIKEIFKVLIQMFWFNYLQPKLIRAKKKANPSLNLESQKLHLQANTIKGELSILKAELEALPFVQGKIYERTLTDKKTGKTRNFHILRTHLKGKPQDKYIVKTKKKDTDLTLSEAEQLIKNAEKADSLNNEIKNREYQIAKIENKLGLIEGRPVEINEPLKEIVNNSLIGRDKEFAQLQSNLLHNISTLLLGEPGIGKSYLVKSLTDSQTRPVLWIENLKAVRSVLIESIIAKLHQDRNLKLDDDNYSLSLTLEEIKSKCLKNKTIEQLAEIISDSVIGKNYICVINSMTGLTIANQVIIDKILLAGVPVFACTNRLKPTVELESIYRRFNQLELQPMKNKYIREITTNKLINVRADETNKQILITRITNSACGNVGIVEKMTKDALALSTGGDLTYDQVYAIQEPYLHRKYFDLTPIVLLSIASFAVLRFIGLGTNDTLLYIIGGIAFIVFMAVSRLLLKTWGS